MKCPQCGFEAPSFQSAQLHPARAGFDPCDFLLACGCRAGFRRHVCGLLNVVKELQELTGEPDNPILDDIAPLLVAARRGMAPVVPCASRDPDNGWGPEEECHCLTGPHPFDVQALRNRVIELEKMRDAAFSAVTRVEPELRKLTLQRDAARQTVRDQHADLRKCEHTCLCLTGELAQVREQLDNERDAYAALRGNKS